MHLAQNISPQPVHSLGLTATLVQIGQSNMSPVRLGKRYLSYPNSLILLTLFILYNGLIKGKRNG